ncbi:MAG: hypothetical protein ACRBF0_11500 [Calditrichia bacterium]
MLKKILLLSFVSLFAFWGCSNEDSILSSDSPITESSSSSQDDITVEQSAFNSQLEAEIASESEDITFTAKFINRIDGPTVITEPGFYRVTKNFSVTEAGADAIVIQSDNVFLSLGGHTIKGPGNKDGRGIVLDNVRNVLVANGRLKTFGIGVVMDGTIRSAVKGIKTVGGDEFADPPNGVAPQIGIMLINSYRNYILWNTYRKVNLGIFVRGGNSFENRILNNTARAGDNGLLAICYNPAPGGDPAGPHDDVVRGNNLVRFGVGISASAESTNNYFVRNRIRFFNDDYVDANGSNVFENNNSRQINP